MTPQQFDTAAAAVKFITAEYGVTVAQVESHSRARKHVLPRYLIMVFCLKYAGMTRRQVSILLNRDQATINHALESLKNYVLTTTSAGVQIAALHDRFQAELHCLGLYNHAVH